MSVKWSTDEVDIEHTPWAWGEFTAGLFIGALVVTVFAFWLVARFLPELCAQDLVRDPYVLTPTKPAGP